MHANKLGLDRDLRRIAEEEAIAIENLGKVDETIKLYEKLAKRFEINIRLPQTPKQNR